MRQLFPEIAPYNSGLLAVSATHSLYFEESGNPEGVPVVFLHGGPGDCSSSKTRRYFNPEKFRIILFDQRGCGQSTPFGELAENSTAYTLEDMEVLRKTLGINTWVVAGTSWGTTLALLYAQTYPQHVRGLLLRSVFLARRQDVAWMVDPWGAGAFYPAKLEQFLQKVAPHTATLEDIIAGYNAKLNANSTMERHQAALDYLSWEGGLCQMQCYTTTPLEKPDTPTMAFLLNLARMNTFYTQNHFFMEDDAVLNNAHRLRGIAGVIVHGRYDLLCPPGGAYALHKAWPGSELNIVNNSAHSGSAPLMVDAFIKTATAFEEF